MKEVTYDVPAVSCQHCVNSISQAAKGVGVEQVEVDIPSKKVFVAFDPAKVSESSLKEAIEEEGYDIAGETPGKAFTNPNAGKKSLNIM
jgi:copper chaperone